MNYGNACVGFDDAEIAELQDIAKTYREAGGLIIKLTGLFGNTVEDALKMVPAAHFAPRSADLAASSTQADENSDGYFNRGLAMLAGERWDKIAPSISGAIDSYVPNQRFSRSSQWRITRAATKANGAALKRR